MELETGIGKKSPEAGKRELYEILEAKRGKSANYLYLKEQGNLEMVKKWSGIAQNPKFELIMRRVKKGIRNILMGEDYPIRESKTLSWVLQEEFRREKERGGSELGTGEGESRGQNR